MELTEQQTITRSFPSEKYPGCAYEILARHDGKRYVPVDSLGESNNRSVCVVKLIDTNSRKVVQVYTARVWYKDELYLSRRKRIEQDIKLK